MKELCDITRQLSKKKATAKKPIKDKNDITITTVENQKRRWAEHFEELINRPTTEGGQKLHQLNTIYQLTV
jgi:hypothetical protein